MSGNDSDETYCSAIENCGTKKLTSTKRIAGKSVYLASPEGRLHIIETLEKNILNYVKKREFFDKQQLVAMSLQLDEIFVIDHSIRITQRVCKQQKILSDLIEEFESFERQVMEDNVYDDIQAIKQLDVVKEPAQRINKACLELTNESIERKIMEDNVCDDIQAIKQLDMDKEPAQRINNASPELTIENLDENFWTNDFFDETEITNSIDFISQTQELPVSRKRTVHELNKQDAIQKNVTALENLQIMPIITAGNLSTPEASEVFNVNSGQPQTKFKQPRPKTVTQKSSKQKKSNLKEILSNKHTDSSSDESQLVKKPTSKEVRFSEQVSYSSEMDKSYLDDVSLDVIINKEHNNQARREYSEMQILENKCSEGETIVETQYSEQQTYSPNFRMFEQFCLELQKDQAKNNLLPMEINETCPSIIEVAENSENTEIPISFENSDNSSRVEISQNPDEDLDRLSKLIDEFYNSFLVSGEVLELKYVQNYNSDLDVESTYVTQLSELSVEETISQAEYSKMKMMSMLYYEEEKTKASRRKC